MSTSIEWTCAQCGSPFSALVEYAQVYCPTCGALLDLLDDEAPDEDEDEDADDEEESFVDEALGLTDISTTDIRQIMTVAFEPLMWRKRTAWEWMRV